MYLSPYERKLALIEILLLNFLFLLLPVLTFLIFFENTLPARHHKFIYILLSTASMFLCMAYPIKLEVGFIFDLRFVPFLILALYNGYKMVFPLYVVLNIYRFFIGGEGVIQSFLFSSVIFIVIPLFKGKFIQLHSKNRVLYATVAAFFTMFLYLLTLSFQVPINQEFWELTFYAIITYSIAIMIITTLIEKIIANMKERETFIHSEKLNIVSELSASVAHEIRNPLTVTNGFLQLLNTSKTISMEEKKYIEYSLLELERAEKIVSDFLVFAKPQSNNMVYSNFKAEIEYVTNVMTPYANMHHVAIQVNFKNLLYKTFDINQIQQCLINLYKNGIEAMKKDGGTLYIDVSERKKKIFIQIRDTGTGMTSEEIAHLGKPYYSTKKEGTGLGMLMVYSTISKVKGKIEVESEVGQGTTFLITIPV